MFNKAQLQKMAEVYFVTGIVEIFACTDGNFFIKEHFANDHATRNNLESLRFVKVDDGAVSCPDQQDLSEKNVEQVPTVSKKKTIKSR